MSSPQLNVQSFPIVSGEHLRKKKWVLTQTAFDGLLSALDSDRERAGERYEQLRRKLSKFFEGRGADDPVEQADETLSRVARKLAEGAEIQDLNQYCLGVARLLLKEEFKRREQQQRAFRQLPQNSHPATTMDDTDEIRRSCFEDCLQNLGTESRELLLAYYQDEKLAKIERRKELAAALGIPLNALRIRVCRIKSQLESCCGRIVVFLSQSRSVCRRLPASNRKLPGGCLDSHLRSRGVRP
ncbi:MAG: hypothetical protein LC742_02350 [Acidobacteria bacterium]|nr:hypothetical protein [Acidobacteriota bacterium]